MSTSADETIRRHPFTVAEYYRMAEAGILGPEARVELIDGEIIDMAPAGSRHAGTVDQLAGLLRAAAGNDAGVRVQHPIALDRNSEPEPDIALVRPRADFYKSAHPVARDVLLIVEVAESSVRYDQSVKGPLYARHGIEEYWIVDLASRRLIRHREPHELAYALVDEPDPSLPVTFRPRGSNRPPEMMLDLSPIFE